MADGRSDVERANGDGDGAHGSSACAGRAVRGAARSGPDVRARGRRSAGRAGGGAAARVDGHRRPQLVELLRAARRAVPRHRPRPSRARARAALEARRSGSPTAPTTSPRCSPCSRSTGAPPSATRWVARSVSCCAGAIPSSSTASCCARRARRSTGRLGSGCCPGWRPAAASSPPRRRCGRCIAAAMAVLRGWRGSRGPSVPGEIAGHDWTRIVEAGREICRFDSRPWLHELERPDGRRGDRRRRRRPVPPPARPRRGHPGRHAARRPRRSHRLHDWRRGASSRPCSPPARRSPVPTVRGRSLTARLTATGR